MGISTDRMLGVIEAAFALEKCNKELLTLLKDLLHKQAIGEGDGTELMQLERTAQAYAPTPHDIAVLIGEREYVRKYNRQLQSGRAALERFQTRERLGIPGPRGAYGPRTKKRAKNDPDYAERGVVVTPDDTLCEDEGLMIEGLDIIPQNMDGKRLT